MYRMVFVETVTYLHHTMWEAIQVGIGECMLVFVFVFVFVVVVLRVVLQVPRGRAVAGLWPPDGADG